MAVRDLAGRSRNEVGRFLKDIVTQRREIGHLFGATQKTKLQVLAKPQYGDVEREAANKGTNGGRRYHSISAEPERDWRARYGGHHEVGHRGHSVDEFQCRDHFPAEGERHWPEHAGNVLQHFRVLQSLHPDRSGRVLGNGLQPFFRTGDVRVQANQHAGDLIAEVPSTALFSHVDGHEGHEVFAQYFAAVIEQAPQRAARRCHDEIGHRGAATLRHTLHVGQRHAKTVELLFLLPRRH